jgi:hypothetical protein
LSEKHNAKQDMNRAPEKRAAVEFIQNVEDAGADVSALERELDELVYALYALTPEEIKIVKGINT